VDGALVGVAAADPATAYVSATLVTVVSVAGCLILFWLARKGGERYLQRHTASPKAQTLALWFQRYGLATVFVPALSPAPLPTKVFVICAGASGVRVAPFVLVVLAARTVRYFGLAYLGARYGEGSLVWVKAHAWYVAAAALGLFVLAAVVVKVGGRLLRRTRLSPSS
jgi:membrane protein YqaA with SNARE-associated domain